MKTSDPFDTDYQIVVYEDETTDGKPCWVAKHPELPGCAAHAHSKFPEDAIVNLARARSAYLADLAAIGKTPPEPTKVGPKIMIRHSTGLMSDASADEADGVLR